MEKEKSIIRQWKAAENLRYSDIAELLDLKPATVAQILSPKRKRKPAWIKALAMYAELKLAKNGGSHPFKNT